MRSEPTAAVRLVTFTVLVLSLVPALVSAQRVHVSVFDSTPPLATVPVAAWTPAPAWRSLQTPPQRLTRRRGRIVLWTGYAGGLIGASIASIRCAQSDSCLQPLNAAMGGVVGFTGGILLGFGLAAIYRDPADRALPNPRDSALPNTHSSSHVRK